MRIYGCIIDTVSFLENNQRKNYPRKPFYPAFGDFIAYILCQRQKLFASALPASYVEDHNSRRREQDDADDENGNAFAGADEAGAVRGGAVRGRISAGVLG